MGPRAARGTAARDGGLTQPRRSMEHIVLFKWKEGVDADAIMKKGVWSRGFFFVPVA